MKLGTEQSQSYNNSHPLNKVINSKVNQDKQQSKQLVSNINDKQLNQHRE